MVDLNMEDREENEKEETQRNKEMVKIGKSC